MKNVENILADKGREVWSIAPQAKVFEAIEIMAAKELGALLVMERGHLVGLISERDYARSIILRGRQSKETQVREIMTTKVVCVSRQHTVEECMALMTDKRLRHLPVVEDGRVCGLISIGDVVRSMIAQKDFIIDQLENYITGTR